MCGLFGFVANGSKRFNLKLIEEIAIDTQRRGPHAFGFAWIDSRNRLRMFKQKGRISDHLAILAIARDARMLIGHCRYATHGKPENNLNNHPHPCDGGWLVHNGVISHYRDLNEGYLLNPVTNCDSETLALMIEELDGKLIDRVSTAIVECAESPLATMALWRSPLRMVAARAGNPLSWVQCDEGTYLASLPDALPDGAESVDDRSLLEFTVRDGQTQTEFWSLDDVFAARV